MLALHDRAETEALTYPEVIDILTMQETDEHDRRLWLLAQKSEDPFKSYSEMRRIVEDTLAENESDDIEDLPNATWLRAT